MTQTIFIWFSKSFSSQTKQIEEKKQRTEKWKAWKLDMAFDIPLFWPHFMSNKVRKHEKCKVRLYASFPFFIYSKQTDPKLVGSWEMSRKRELKNVQGLLFISFQLLFHQIFALFHWKGEIKEKRANPRWCHILRFMNSAQNAWKLLEKEERCSFSVIWRGERVRER